MASSSLIAAVITTAELMGNELSENAAKMFVTDLGDYDEQQVFEALKRCRQEVKGKLTVADVVQRIDFNHIGAEEAWALCPRSEADSVVWTDEIAKAYFIALPILESGDKIGARMAFKEAYARLVNEARQEKRAATWYPSLGFDPNGRQAAVNKAKELGRLPKSEELPRLESQRKAISHGA